ncbi:DUF397 domain-containing protein [Allosalinactinospora lopnorensis]|uniref:DUF397 domain-containing protein n=1 Tax=Allosalinactinospora lopnorensis TaxID=1352348 RepID=UPI000623CAE9|nr:DUF397 domain-containing protein [Allosalinactinospora lopnorensis]
MTSSDGWFKSSYSKGGMDNCVECRTDRGTVDVRDTQNRSAGHLSFPVPEWSAFLADLRTGDL